MRPPARGLLVTVMVVGASARAQPFAEDALDWAVLPAPPVDAQPVGSLAVAGNPLEQRLADLEKARDTGDFEGILRQLEELQGTHPGNGEILWRLARTGRASDGQGEAAAASFSSLARSRAGRRTTA